VDTKNLIKHICSSLDTRKAEDILVLDIQSVSSIADFLLLLVLILSGLLSR